VSEANENYETTGSRGADAIDDAFLKTEHPLGLPRCPMIVPEEVERVLSTVSESIATEIHRSLDFFLSTSGGVGLSHVYLAGGAAPTPGLSGAIEAACGAPVTVVDPFRRIGVDERAFNPRFLADLAAQAAVAVGLGLRRGDDK
jgi:type IV pilus assembly protein PilM